MSRSPRSSAPRRQDRRVQSSRNDAYRLREKLPEPSLCSRCGALYRSGYWSWPNEAPHGAHSTLCGACQRIRDRFPAGILDLHGGFLTDHRQEILNLAQNIGEESRRARPLGRIMDIETSDKGDVRITTTDVNTARRIGEAVHRAYQGDLSFQYADDDKLIRLRWQR